MSIPPVIAQAFDVEELVYVLFFVIWIVSKILGSIFGKKEEETEEDAGEEKQRADAILREIRRKRDERRQASGPVQPQAQPVRKEPISFHAEPQKQVREIHKPEAEHRKSPTQPLQAAPEVFVQEAVFDYEGEWKKQKERLAEVERTVQKVSRKRKQQAVKKKSDSSGDLILQRLKNRESLKEAVVLSEILGRPRSETM